MGNIISFDGHVSPNDDTLSISNGGTDVLINILALSGSELAITENQKRLIVYLLEKDQSCVGRGTVDFNIVQIPWNTQTFQEDKQFIIDVINGAKNKIGWNKLDYQPNEKLVSAYLEKFEKLINRMTINDIHSKSLETWLSYADENDPIHCNFPRCKKHNTLLTCFGCQVCNN